MESVGEEEAVTYLEAAGLWFDLTGHDSLFTQLWF